MLAKRYNSLIKFDVNKRFVQPSKNVLRNGTKNNRSISHYRKSVNSLGLFTHKKLYTTKPRIIEAESRPVSELSEAIAHPLDIKPIPTYRTLNEEGDLVDPSKKLEVRVTLPIDFSPLSLFLSSSL